MAKIKGKDIIIYVAKDGVNTPICCGRELELIINTELIEATKAPNSRAKNFITGDESYSIRSSNIVSVGEDIDVMELYKYQRAGIPIEFVMLAKIESKVFFSGKILINNLAINANHTDIATYTITAQGDGELIIDNPYRVIFLEDGEGNLIEDGNGNPIISEIEHGDLNPIDLTNNC